MFDIIFRGAFRKRIEITYKLLGNLEGKEVLDAGCGPGFFLLEAVRNGAAKVTGIDFSSEMMNIAYSTMRTKYPGGENWELKNIDLEKFVPANSFDIALIIGVLEYLESPLDILKSMRGFVRDSMIVSFSRKNSLYSMLRFYLLGIKKIKITLNSLQEIELLAREAGFRVIEAHRIGPSFLVMLKPVAEKPDA